MDAVKPRVVISKIDTVHAANVRIQRRGRSRADIARQIGRRAGTHQHLFTRPVEPYREEELQQLLGCQYLYCCTSKTGTFVPVN
jgi:hypothetical protein